MRRSERLTEIVEIIRDGRLHLARDIAEALEVSERTIYRDIATLIASGVRSMVSGGWDTCCESLYSYLHLRSQ